MAPNARDAPRFPVGAYAQYKQATEYFLDWLLLARSYGSNDATAGSSSTMKLKLDAFQSVVDKIAGAPVATLTPRLLSTLPKALAACRVAIALRERVSLFFASATAQARSDAMQRHEHFLGLLKTWYKQLLRVSPQAPAPSTRSRSNSAAAAPTAPSKVPVPAPEEGHDRFGTYYDVLAVDDDYFDDSDALATMQELALEATCSATMTAAPAPLPPTRASLSSAARDALFNDAFAQDLLFETASYLLELEDLAEGVHTAYAQVKTEAKTLVEATAVAHVAIACASEATARLQKRYPSIRTPQDLATVLDDHFPSAFQTKSRAIVRTFSARMATDGYVFTPGLFISELLWVMSTLGGFTSAIPPDNRRSALMLRDGFFGEAYSEDQTPQYVFPDPLKPSSLLLQQLPLLYNALLLSDGKGSGLDRSTFAGSFMAMMDTFFTDKVVTLSLAFAVVCWTKAVGCLQGNGDLGKHVSWSITQCWELRDRVGPMMVNCALNDPDPWLMLKLLPLSKELSSATKSTLLLRGNPLLAGSVLLDCQFKYLAVAAEMPSLRRRLCTFGHLYAAMVDRELLKRLPFLDDLLERYSVTISSPSQAAAVAGSFAQAHASSLAALSTQKTLQLQDISDLYRLLVTKDTGVLGRSMASRQRMLEGVGALASTELFASRVLSRDMLVVDATLLDIEGHAVEIIKTTISARIKAVGAHGVRVPDLAFDDVAPMLLSSLDVVDRATGKANDAELLRVRGLTQAIPPSVGLILCAEVARALDDAFAHGATDVDATYFVVPRAPDVVTQAFGETHVEDKYQDVYFQEMMHVMEASTGRLTPDELAWLQFRIKNQPDVLELVAPYSVYEAVTTGRNVRTELGSLLHQAAAGPAHDIRLVEWMIQMGALKSQAALHCRTRRGRSARLDAARSELPDQMAVHSAAIAGYTDIVLLLLEADHLRDLNTRTSRGNESLLMLAVKHGHRELFDLLVGLGAKADGVDASGKRLVDMTRDASWQRTIRALTAAQTSSRERIDAHKNRDALFLRLQHARADAMRASLVKQRERERVSSGLAPSATLEQTTSSDAGDASASFAARAEAPTASSSTKKKSKKKKKKGGKKPADGAVSELTTALPSALVEPRDSSSGAASHFLRDLLRGDADAHDDAESSEPNDAMAADALVALLAQLNTTTSTTDSTEDDVRRASKSVVQFMDTVAVLAKPDHINVTSALMRASAAKSALKVIHAMQKVHRRTHCAAVASALAPLKQLCASSTDFLIFVLETAQLLGSIDRPGQARELLELVEARLLAMKANPPSWFFEAAHKLADVRDDLGLEPAPAVEALLDSEDVDLDDLMANLWLDMTSAASA